MNKAWLRRRLRDSITFWYQLILGQRFVAKRLGLHLLFDLDDIVDKYLLAFRAFESAEQRLLFDAVTAGVSPGQRNIFIDVGAHSGLYALLAWQSKLFNRIIAIEADPRNFAQLKANLFLNRAVTQIDAVEAAASNVAGELTFSLASDRGRDLSMVAGGEKKPGFTDYAVRSVRIDDLENMEGGFLAAKIDVEGHETQVIQGMLRLLKANRCCLQIEVWPNGVPEFLELMKGLGFNQFSQVGNNYFFKNY